ncbi:MAG: hypothetical protein AVO38_15745 [delta proteobacterium ML8_D]|jgi:NAD(P)-dependent dehydrogenase (short-subunit alcohol dehydrogenase family)|nr:MAG: hypothetical protein AVO38_15745 [delta proteobacterium ML8_D]
MKKTISIDNRTVGSGQPVYIVAEMSANHNQDFDHAVKLIQAAKAGLLQMRRWLAAHLGSVKILVNSISPGSFPQWNVQEKAPDFLSKLAEKTLLG